jgi:cell division protein FtsL
VVIDMDSLIKNNQAFFETPWRKQLQRVGLFLVALVLFAIIAGIYLSVNAKAATIGRQIQNDRLQISELENEIADYQSQLAILTSATEMEKRAGALGFRQASTDEILYLVIEGYYGRQPAVLASDAKSFITVTSPTLSPEYTMSLVDWLQSNFINSSWMETSLMP